MKTCAINTCTHCYLPGTILNINSLNPFNNLTDEKMKAWKILKITCPRSHHHEWQSQDSNRGSLALERHALQYHAMPLYSQLQLWLLITITWEFLKIPRPRLEPPDQLNQKLWRWALGIGAFLKLPGNSSVQPRLRTTALMQSTRNKTKALTYRPRLPSPSPHSLIWPLDSRCIRQAPRSGPFNSNVLCSVKPSLDIPCKTANAPNCPALSQLPFLLLLNISFAYSTP